jgi:hypothetical protein
MKLFCLLLSLLFASPEAFAEKATLPFDHSEWDRFLKKYVNEKGELAYARARGDLQLLDLYFEKLRRIPQKEFKFWPREEQLAIFINAYNAAVVKLILKHYPVKTVMNIPGFWDQGAVQIGDGRSRSFYSLNKILNDVLRGRFRDEKILFALSSGAKSSPRLRPEAYVGRRLEGQLYRTVKDFVNDKAKNRIKPGEKKIVLSRLFKWHAKDFLLNWGNFPEDIRWNPEEMAALSFIVHYLDDVEKVKYLQNAKYKITYETFDWSLNDSA